MIDSLKDKNLRNHIWHADGGFRPDAPAFTALFAYQLPDSGGDTMFSNTAWVYEHLDPLFAAYLESLTVIQSADATGHITDRYLDAKEAADARLRMPSVRDAARPGSPCVGTEVDRRQRVLHQLHQRRKPDHEPEIFSASCST